MTQGRRGSLVIAALMLAACDRFGSAQGSQQSPPGDFNDTVQQQFGQMLMQLTQANKQIPIVTYCQGPQCWMSYNAALRAIALGYRNVRWYRGGLEAWQRGMSAMAGVGGQPPSMTGPLALAQPDDSGGDEP